MYFSIVIIQYNYYFRVFLGSGMWPPKSLLSLPLNALCNLKKQYYNMMVTLVMIKTKQNMVMLFHTASKPGSSVMAGMRSWMRRRIFYVICVQNNFVFVSKCVSCFQRVICLLL